jgi:hypothetical protein
LEDLGVDGRISIIMDRRETWWEGVDWIRPVHDRNQCQDLGSTVMDLRVP